jgi:hypothetical protein
LLSRAVKTGFSSFMRPEKNMASCGFGLCPNNPRAWPASWSAADLIVLSVIAFARFNGTVKMMIVALQITPP